MMVGVKGNMELLLVAKILLFYFELAYTSDWVRKSEITSQKTPTQQRSSQLFPVGPQSKTGEQIFVYNPFTGLPETWLQKNANAN